MRVNRAFRDIGIRTLLHETNSAARKYSFNLKIQKVLKFEDRLYEIKYGEPDDVNFAWMTGSGGIATQSSEGQDQVDREKQLVFRMNKVRQQAWDWEFARL